MTIVPSERVDVVVLGGGLAGCAAMLAAAEAGRSVVLLEKRDAVGGSTVLSAGLSAFAGTHEQAAAGIEDSADLLRSDLIETGLHLCDERLVDLYCDNQLATYRWFKGHGIRYGTVHAASGQTVPRSHPTDTTLLLDTLVGKASELGGRLVTGVAARRLLREDGRVVAVEVEAGGRRERVGADAVVVTTGGFTRNEELLTRFAPQLRHALRAGGEENHGDGLLMAWHLGAGLVDTPHIKGTYGTYPEPHPAEPGPGILAVYKGAIAVNRNGRRFVDESLPYKILGDASLAQPGGWTYQVFDANVMARGDAHVAIYDFAARERGGVLVRADTVAELAAKLDLPAGEFERTVEDYNARIAAGEPDPLGRARLSGGVGQPVPLTTPPFYAHPSGTVVLATYCGLTVDTQLRVLDVFGEPIDGLYAAGEVIGGLHGGGYMTGTSIGKAGIFGRLAGTAAAGRAA